MSIKLKVNKLITELQTGIQAQGLNNRKDIGSFALSAESMDADAAVAARSGKDMLDESIMSAISVLVSTESMGLHVTEAQRKSAQLIGALATNPEEAHQAIMGGSTPKAGAGAVTVSAEDMGILDAVHDVTLSSEAFDSQSLSNSLYTSIAYNVLATKQDEFNETFFPIIAIDPTMSGITIGTEVTSLYDNFDRGVDGSTSRSKFNKTPLVKAIHDNNTFGVDRNKLVPVSRTEDAAVLVPTLERVDSSNGTSVTTAPIKMGVSANLLGISQTDAQLAKGTMDATDALDHTLNLETVYFSLTDSSATPVTEYFAVPVAALPHSNFVPTTQDHEKDLALSFDTNSIVFSTSNTTQADGSPSVILAALTAAHKVNIRLKLNGDSNTQYGDVSVYANVVEVVSVLNAAGQEITAGATFDTISALFGTIQAVGYDLEAYSTNSNLRNQGQLVTIDRLEQIYAVPVRSGISVVMPIGSNSNDDSRLVGQIQTTGIRMSMDGIKTLVNYADRLKVLTDNGSNTNVELAGVGRHHVDSYYREFDLDLLTIVDSESSSDRSDDIRASIIGRIRDQVYSAWSASKLNVSHELMNGNGTPAGVIIGTSGRLKSYLCGEDGLVDLGAGFVVKVVSTSNTLIGDSIYVTFSDHMSSERNTSVDPLSFGQCVWAPTITNDVAVTTNGAVTRRLQTHPRYAHIVNLPIMVRFNVTNIEGVLGKVTRNHTAV